jgi:hypothetical protein
MGRLKERRNGGLTSVELEATNREIEMITLNSGCQEEERISTVKKFLVEAARRNVQNVRVFQI